MVPSVTLPCRLPGAFAAALLLAGCQAGERPSPVASATPIAFEGFVGVPEPVGNRVAGELMRAADGSRFTLVPPTDASARYVMRGYLAPAADARTVAYVWDLYDRAGNRTQRVSGDMRLPAEGETWAVLAENGARPLALVSAASLDRFLAQPSAPPEPAAVPAAEPAPEPPVPTTAAAAAATARQPGSPGRRISIEGVQGVEDRQGSALVGSMRQALWSLGYAVVEAGQPADFRLAAEATLNPAERAGQLLSVQWRVRDARGAELGEVRQLARLRTGGGNGVEPALTQSVERVLPGLVALAPPRG